MKWTSEKPTKPGFYWLTENHLGGRRQTTIVEIAMIGDLTVKWVNGARDTVDRVSGQWSGPIPEPEEA